MNDDPSFNSFLPPKRAFPSRNGPRCDRRVDEYVQAVLFMRKSGRESVPTAAVVALVAFLRKEWDAPSVGLVERHCEQIGRGWQDVPAAPDARLADRRPVFRRKRLAVPPSVTRTMRQKREQPETPVPPDEIGTAASLENVDNLLRPDFFDAVRTKRSLARRRQLRSVVLIPNVVSTAERSDPSPG